jgi:hypothetical protein
VTLMQQSLINTDMKDVLRGVTYLVGNDEIVTALKDVSPKCPFDDSVVEFLNSLSKILMKSREAKAYPDVITLGFWMRKSSVLAFKERFVTDSSDIKIGRGVAFHIAPSNVPVNYAYSLLTGLLTGNANVVRIPSKDFPQVSIINKAINEALEEYPDMKPYICLVRYGRDQKVNDMFSALADTRIIWGGDNTIAEIRKSPLGPRAGEIAFADRYSLAVIDSDKYMEVSDKERLAEEFYNDTYLSDQNACTSPRLVVWMGEKKEEAKELFWKYEHDLVKKKYQFQSIMGINKLTSSYLMTVSKEGVHVEQREDNYIVRVNVPEVNPDLMQLKDNSGYFFEYDCDDIIEIRDFCNNTHCQTIGFLGEKETIMPLLISGIKGVDRVVPIGKTMDFDFIWDGYNLVERLTRTIKVNI